VEYLTVLVAVVAAFYFILLRPVMAQQRKHRRDISALSIGDEVLTTAGFYATVVEINTYEDRPMEILLEAAPGVILRGTPGSVDSIARHADSSDTDQAATDDVDSSDGTVDDAAGSATSTESRSSAR
jgi:preprotein translocase subunit YajC